MRSPVFLVAFPFVLLSGCADRSPQAPPPACVIETLRESDGTVGGVYQVLRSGAHKARAMKLRPYVLIRRSVPPGKPDWLRDLLEGPQRDQVFGGTYIMQFHDADLRRSIVPSGRVTVEKVPLLVLAGFGRWENAFYRIEADGRLSQPDYFIEASVWDEKPPDQRAQALKQFLTR